MVDLKNQKKELEEQMGGEIKSLSRELSNLKKLMDENLPKQVVNHNIKKDGQPKQVTTQPPNSEVGAKGGAIPKITTPSKEGRDKRVPSPNREDSGEEFDPQSFIPKVIPVTDQNKGRVSRSFFGLIRNNNGTVYPLLPSS